MDRAASFPVRDIARLATILRVAAVKGWGRYVERIGLARLAADAAPAPDAIQTDAARLRAALEELGPTFVKFGQMLSVRQDLLPEPFARELQHLQSDVPPFPSPEARAIVERELGAGVESLFERFDEAPLAAASLCQVHRARLHDGTEVVVKIQRPGIAATIEADLSLLRFLARLLDRHVARLQQFNLVGLVEEFAETIRRELDFSQEGANGESFAVRNRDEPAVEVPRVFWQLTTPRVLTMAFSTGAPIDERHPPGPAERRRLAATLMRLFLTHVLEHGVFHADPHPGNIFVMPDGRLCFHDFGALGRLAVRDQENLRQLFLAVIARDPEWLADTYVAMGGVAEGFDRAAFVRDLGRALERYYGSGVATHSFSIILAEFVHLGREHHVRLLRETALVAKAFMIIEATTKTLDPEFDSIAAFRDYTSQLLADLARPDASAASLARMYRSLYAVRSSVARLPVAVDGLLEDLRHGGLAFRIRHERLEGLELALQRATNRLGFSLIIAALVIGSAIVLTVHAGPHFEDFPLLGVAGFGVAAALGLVWALLALRSGREQR